MARHLASTGTDMTFYILEGGALIRASMGRRMIFVLLHAGTRPGRQAGVNDGMAFASWAWIGKRGCRWPCVRVDGLRGVADRPLQSF
jgi:hypothetical protein